MTKIQVKTMGAGEVVHEVDITGRSEREVERIEMGMLRNMNLDGYYIGVADD